MVAVEPRGQGRCAGQAQGLLRTPRRQCVLEEVAENNGACQPAVCAGSNLTLGPQGGSSVGQSLG